MSTFSGKIIEIPEISVDRFDGDNANSLIYFLSHCHTDHMIGLSDWGFQNGLVQRPDVYLYASPISVKILKNMYPAIESKLKEIPIHNSTLVKVPYRNDVCVTITTLPAGHCPGSVMFLFEISNKNILYTGDYRVSANDLKKYQAFYSLGTPKKIDKMYLDTTFFKLSFFKLPSRCESISNMCKVIKEWIEQSSHHLIEITVSATYGSEFLFIEIAKAVGMPIHVNETTYKIYKCIPEMDNAMTLNSQETQIHANCGNKFKEICKQNDKLIRAIVPSTLWWEGRNMDKDCMVLSDDGRYRVCYSCHASFEEIEDFLMFLKPLEIEPCVVPSNRKEKKEMFKLLQDVISTYKFETVSDDAKLFDIKNDNVEKSATTPVKEDFGALSDILCSPTRNFKRKRLWLNGNEDGTSTS